MDDLSIEQMREVAEAATQAPLQLKDCGRDGWKLYAPGFGVVAHMGSYDAHPDPQAEQAANARFFETFQRARILKMLDALAKARDIEQYGDCSYWCPACYADITDPKYPVHPHIDGEAEYLSWGIIKVEVPT